MEQITQKFINAQNHEERLNVLRSMKMKELREFMAHECIKSRGKSKEDIVRHILATIESRYIQIDAGEKVIVGVHFLGAVTWHTEIAQARRNHVSSDILTEEMIDAEYEAYEQSKAAKSEWSPAADDFKELTEIFTLCDARGTYSDMYSDDFYAFNKKMLVEKPDEYEVACIINSLLKISSNTERQIDLNRKTSKVLSQNARLLLKKGKLPTTKAALITVILEAAKKYEESKKLKIAKTQKDYRKGEECGRLYLSGTRFPLYDELERYSLSRLSAIAKVMNIGGCEGKTTHEIIKLILAKSKELERARGRKYPLNYEQAVTHINKLFSENGGYYKDGDIWGVFGANAVWFIMMDCDNAGIKALFKYVAGREFIGVSDTDFYSYNERKVIADRARYMADKIMNDVVKGYDTRKVSEAGKVWYENYLLRYPHEGKIA